MKNKGLIQTDNMMTNLFYNQGHYYFRISKKTYCRLISTEVQLKYSFISSLTDRVQIMRDITSFFLMNSKELREIMYKDAPWEVRSRFENKPIPIIFESSIPKSSTLLNKDKELPEFYLQVLEAQKAAKKTTKSEKIPAEPVPVKKAIIKVKKTS